MKRSAPMKRSGFKPKLPPRPCKVYEVFTPRPRAVAVARSDGKARIVVPVPKHAPIQHEGYMATVRQLPCYRCGIVGFTQFCHADEGKGAALKTDCRRGWPGCGPHQVGDRMVPGCHYEVGSTGTLSKAARRAFEEAAGKATRATILSSGKWSESLPMWMEVEEAPDAELTGAPRR